MNRRLPFAATIAVALLACASAVGDEIIASGSTRDCFLVDTCGGARIASGTASVSYAPVYSLDPAPFGSYVVLHKVERPDTANATTSVVATCAADVADTFEFEQEGVYVRFLHELRNAGGSRIGDTLVSDLSMTYPGVASAPAVVDSRTNSLQLVVKAERGASLAYSTSWVTNASALTISAVRLTGPGGVATATNAVFSAGADASGDFLLRGLDPGWWCLSCLFGGGAGDSLLEYVTDGFKMPGGVLFIVR